MKIRVFTAQLTMCAIALSAGLVIVPQSSAEAAYHDCVPKAAGIKTENRRLVGTGKGACGNRAIPEYLTIGVIHYYPVWPDPEVFAGTVRKPSNVTSWYGTVRRCDKSTTGDYYSTVRMVQWSQNGSKDSVRKRLSTCAGTGA